MAKQQTPSEYLRGCRATANISARTLSLAIGAEESYISTVERRGVVPPFDELRNIEKHLPGFDALEMCRLALIPVTA